MAYGKLKVDKIQSSAEELTLPTSAGSSGQVLTTDGSGVLSFASNPANTDLSVAANGTSLTVESSSGDNVTLPQATSSTWGVMSDEDKSKLDLIEPLATADQTDAEIRAAVGAATDSNIFTDADHLKLNEIEPSSNNYAITTDLLDEDDFASNSATKAASQQSIKVYVDTEVADLVDSSPAALDTLAELATALGDDENFSTTVTNSISLKAPIDDPSFTGSAAFAGSLTADSTIKATEAGGTDALRVEQSGFPGTGQFTVTGGGNVFAQGSITAVGAATFATVSDSKGDVRSIPQNTQASTYTLVAADAGKHILASGTVEVPDDIFSAGDAVTIINDTASDLTITKTITTMYNTADDGDSDDRTLATRGMATILFASGTVSYISGAGLS